jgi:hypothetical protein
MDRNPLMLLHLLNLYRETNQGSLSLNERDFVNLKSFDRSVESHAEIPAKCSDHKG